MTKWVFSIGFTVAMFACFGVTLVKDGRDVSEIVIADRPTLDIQFAARELQYHIKLISGVEIPVVKASESKPGKVRLLVGDSAGAQKLGFKRENYRNEQYELKFIGNDIVMIGNDALDYTKLDCNNFQRLPRFFTPEHGTIWAVYDFLEKCCDMRWYGPGDIGITFTPRKTLAVEPVHIRREPYMSAFRAIWLPRDIVSKNCYTPEFPISSAELEIFMLRWRMVSRYGWANHNVYSLYYAYWRETANPAIAKLKPFKEHRPEYFAQGYEGKAQQNLISVARNFPGDKDVPPQPCQSHPDVIRYFAKEAVDAYNGIRAPGAYGAARTPGAPFYYPIVEDDNHALCKCKTCSAMFADKGELRQNYIHYWWTNEIAKEAKKLNPEVGIVTLSYGAAPHYPHGIKLEDNLSVEMVLHCSNWFHPAYREREMKIFDDWTSDSASGKRLVTLWTHYLSPVWDAKMVEKYNDYFPVFFYRQIGEFFKKCAERRVMGWHGESPVEMGYPLVYTQLELYVSIRLADDPSLDLDTLIEEFFPRWYGNAAEPMRKFYKIIEDTGWDPKNYPKEYSDRELFRKTKLKHSFHPESVNWGMLGTAERMKSLETCVAEAEKRVKTPVEKARFEIFKKGLWEPMKRGRAAYEMKQQFRKRPIPELTIPKVGSADGDPRKVDWTKAVSSANWKTVQGFPDKPGRFIQFVHDGQYLYLRFTEKCDGTALKSAADIWADSDRLEFFFAAERKKPYTQFAVNPDGKTFSQGYFVTADAAFSTKWDFHEKTDIVKDKDQFVFQAAFPLSRLLPDARKEGDSFYANFYRSEPERIAASWSPTFTNSFHELERLGKLNIGK